MAASVAVRGRWTVDCAALRTLPFREIALQTARELSSLLQRLDGRSYRAYRDLEGAYDFDDLAIFVDHVQGDPFAAPSKLRARMPLAVADLPDHLLRNRVRRIALGDFLVRSMAGEIRKGTVARGADFGRGSGHSGRIDIDAGGQEVLERSAVAFGDAWVEVRLQVGLPAAGRRILGREAEELLCRVLPSAIRRGLQWSALAQAACRGFVECVENQEAIRNQLEARGLIAFVADGSILPRESGASDRPMRPADAVPFRSPDSLTVSFDLPNAVGAAGAASNLKSIRGMGIPMGVTLVVGGGYHGKSTLLRALERGVYPHIPGDGREYVVASPHLVKVRAEDGRSVSQVDIHAFIDRLPGERPTVAFDSDDASGSTSQAANIAEAVEAGARGLLLDEDTSATNFMVRDGRMQALVHADSEPITPFVDRVRELYEVLGVSTLLVMGGCGDYFEVADRVLMMRDYTALDVTEEARSVALEIASPRRREARGALSSFRPRVLRAAGFDPSRGRRDVKIDGRGVDAVSFGEERIELRAVEQLVDSSQTRAIGLAIHLASQRFIDDESTLAEILDALDSFLDERGLDPLDPFYRPEHHPGNLARPRRFEIAAAINRLRTGPVRPLDLRRS